MPARLIAHQIQKKQHSKESKCILRDSLLAMSNGMAEPFMQSLRSALAHKNPVAGRFVRIGGGKPVFEQRISTYLANSSDDEFISFSRDATRLLESKMITETASTGGYVAFAEYDQGTDGFVLVAVLSTTAEPSFDEKLNLIAASRLDFDHLRYAGRIRAGAVQTNDDGVVHFVSRSTEKMSDYFRSDFLGCEPVTDSAAQGRQLFSSLTLFAETHKMSGDQKQELLEQTYSYWSSCRKKDEAMTLTGLAHFLRPNDPTIILNHLSAESSGLAGEFPPPSMKVMRCFRKFSFAQSGLKLEFDRNNWLANITVRERSVTIRNAPEDLVRMLTDEKNAD